MPDIYLEKAPLCLIWRKTWINDQNFRFHNKM